MLKKKFSWPEKLLEDFSQNELFRIFCSFVDSHINRIYQRLPVPCVPIQLHIHSVWMNIFIPVYISFLWIQVLENQSLIFHYTEVFNQCLVHLSKKRRGKNQILDFLEMFWKLNIWEKFNSKVVIPLALMLQFLNGITKLYPSVVVSFLDFKDVNYIIIIKDVFGLWTFSNYRHLLPMFIHNYGPNHV